MNFPYKIDVPGFYPCVSFDFCLYVTCWDSGLRMCSLPFLHGIVFIQFLVCVWDGLTCSTDWFELFEIGWPLPWTCDSLPSLAPKCEITGVSHQTWLILWFLTSPCSPMIPDQCKWLFNGSRTVFQSLTKEHLPPVSSEEASVAMTAIPHKYDLIACILMSLGPRRKETFLCKHL